MRKEGWRGHAVVIVATYKERLEHEAAMSKLNHQAELERHTSQPLRPLAIQ